MTQPEALARPDWRSTGNPRFPLTAEVDGHRWVVRANVFPDHCMWTLFIDGVVRFDINDTPRGWGRLDPAGAAPLDPVTANAALAPVRHLVAYGSEVGRPCDGPFCCDRDAAVPRELPAQSPAGTQRAEPTSPTSESLD